MTPLPESCWPEPNDRPSDPFGVAHLFDEAIDAARDGEPIADKYGLIAYPPAAGVAILSTNLPSLGMDGLDFLALLDPAELQRVRDRAHARCRRAGRAPAFILMAHECADAADWARTYGTGGTAALERERAALARCGLTLEQARAFVAERRPAAV